MPSSTIIYTGIAGVALYLVSYWWKTRIPRGLKRPPGPPGHFLTGNLLDLPRSEEWLTFNRWTKEYGDLFYLSVPGASLLFVNSYELANELFDKRGSIYSDRYQSTIMNELLPLRSSDEVYESPENYRRHVRCYLGALVLEVTYGIEATSEEDPLLVLSENTVQRVTEAGIPGTYLVDIFPVLKHIPSWFPGAKFQRELNQLGKQVTEMLNKPVEIAKASLKRGDARSSVVSALIENFENDPDRPDDHEDIIKQVPGLVYIGAIDTYTRAVFQELLRWNAVAPVGVPHTLKVDDVVNGCFIPKGTIVFGNTWQGISHPSSLLRSKSVYGPDADKFNPERFLDKGMPPPDFAFGYGRRECPGRYFAQNGAFIAMVNILHLFNILPLQGGNGPELPPENHFESGTVLQPKPFKLRIIPRSPDTIKTLEELDH
ncbi:hypothetical protein Clacol_005267 [Clathrus columnatus]|uniref:Cytochrome P450 n=1 Tax=Clathrus columnatus TaxID=1419009 RepID=A0AAV5ADF7_9AGAM|nr:hypothetical protein Clacol_005267 [Clathrus columnatus]